jgi:pantoate--beta-alanine ligase
MIIFKQAAHLRAHLNLQQSSGKNIGFVPTMGALHMGHISLVEQSQMHCDLTLVSIFVNPTQFNDASDLEKYPRPTESDIELLSHHKVDYLYLPEVEDIYTNDAAKTEPIDLGYLDEILEGAFRPGHFAGVAQVVNLLLERVQPDQLFMGQKDYQQIAVVRKMIDQMGHATQLVMCPIIREPNGLAMSSRNRRLPPDIKSQAKILFNTLLYAKTMRKIFDVSELEKRCFQRLNRHPFRPEYFQIIDAQTLREIQNWDESQSIVACTAVWAGDVRLIDNMVF